MGRVSGVSSSCGLAADGPPPPVVMAHYSYRGHWHAIHSQPLASHRSRVAWHGSVELACSGWGYDCLQWCGIHSRDHGPVMAARIGRPAGCRLYQSAPPRVRACWQRSARIYLWTRLSSTSSAWLCSQIPLRRSGYRVMGLRRLRPPVHSPGGRLASAQAPRSGRRLRGLQALVPLASHGHRGLVAAVPL